MERYALLKTSLIDFPGRVAAVIFTAGCNLRCPYCHNADLVMGQISQEEGKSIPEIEAFLRKRAPLLGGVCISGGEPLLSPGLFDLVALLVAMEMPWKLDTNGTLPKRLGKLLDQFPDHSPSLVAVDLKSSFEAYPRLLGYKTKDGSAAEAVKKAIFASIGELARHAVPWEARTTVDPAVITPQELATLARSLAQEVGAGRLETPTRWSLQAFRPGSCLDPDWNKRPATGKEEMQSYADALKAAELPTEIIIRG
ncbi:anaerobic ribonucleoside-triphosphate reductase activating protein [Sediminispirochaeta smaragdinae]|jgi:pyruvate formate lyase activating enzyme|uniref:Anaerobic ribonucleoside-triphosphate reductase activating protein n=1 Tax=Sediminispirochaeta smaragdinae (strain DSM 11293 / JCM 15392 / SEBR 4228) TaxID=573413 RepID=E1R545_SEDSS|nr:anaerobic ribonucleoside-triphosphate reductase activating protein [Sediminispirochaeta smaragdinae]ADK80580.1 anaerobic ribonucleoside-triphosphate reductase activating protein [Sediminispirochaeta smaragdinae DSM 11293]